MKQTILVVAAGPLQIPAIEEAASLGVRSVAVDANPLAPGMALADAAHVVDIMNGEAVARIARAERIDGVMTLCSDAPVRTVAAVASALHLPALSPTAALNATDKRLMRKMLAAHDVPQPEFREVDSSEEALAAADLIGYPVVVKAPCSSGSRGVFRVDHPSDVPARISQARKYQPQGGLLVEEWIDGPEVSVEGVCVGDQVHVVQVTDKLLFPGDYPVEAGHTQPSRLPAMIVARIRVVTERGVRALELSDCAFHAELRVSRDEPKIVEIGARLGGDRIATHLTPLSTGVNLVRGAIEIAVGKKPNVVPTIKRGSAVRYFHVDGAGTVERVEGLYKIPSMPGLELLYAASERDGPLRPGLSISEIHSSLDRYGHVVFSGENADQASERAEKAASMINIRFFPMEQLWVQRSLHRTKARVAALRKQPI